MCYSVDSSLRTTAISLFAIVYLWSSGDPHFKWLAITLVGWCLMQFAELLLWLTDPRKGCTDWNTVITMTLIPLVLMLQPLGSLLGSLFVTPWAKSSGPRKYFLVLYSLLIVTLVGIYHFYDPYKICTTVTPDGHLFWATTNHAAPKTLMDTISYYLWALLIILPLLLFWDKHMMSILLLIAIPAFGFFYGDLNTDSKASIWCFYTSYTSVIASAFLLLKQTGIYSIV
jgi:hypothetical protein